jgi:ABC-2 type transport system permease protein
MKILRLFIIEVKMAYWVFKRYYFDSSVGVIVLCLLFTAAFHGTKSLGGDCITPKSLDAIIVGYVVWLAAFSVIQVIGPLVLMEAEMGTLEQLFLSPIAAEIVFMAKTLAAIISQLIFMPIVLFLVMFISDRWLTINFIHFFSILVISLLSLIGVSFMIGAIALIHKRVGKVFPLIGFGLVGFMMLNVYPLNYFSFLPFIAGAYTINSAVVDGNTFPFWWYMFIMANSMFYVIISLFVFRIYANRARKMNKLAQY